MVNDCKNETYWAVNDGVLNASLEIDFQESVMVNAMLIREYIRLGQRICAFTIEAMMGEEYQEVATGTTVGNRRIVKFPMVETDKLRINLDAKAPPVISTIEVYRTPEL